MNKTKIPTVDKITFPLRLPPYLYKKIRARVNEIKEKDNYAFSISDRTHRKRFERKIIVLIISIIVY